MKPELTSTQPALGKAGSPDNKEQGINSANWRTRDVKALTAGLTIGGVVYLAIATPACTVAGGYAVCFAGVAIGIAASCFTATIIAFRCLENRAVTPTEQSNDLSQPVKVNQNILFKQASEADEKTPLLIPTNIV